MSLKIMIISEPYSLSRLISLSLFFAGGGGVGEMQVICYIPIRFHITKEVCQTIPTLVTCYKLLYMYFLVVV